MSDRAIILGAGRGRRMGGPKALMNVGGRLWWSVQRERIEGACVSAVWVVAPGVAVELESGGVESGSIVRSDPHATMFESVRRGIDRCRGHPPAEGVFILPMDVPAPGRRVWVELAAAGEAGVSAPVCGGRGGHPVFLSWRWIERVLDPIVERARRDGNTGRLRLDGVIGREVNAVPVDDECVLTNLNTPGDVAMWLAGHPTGVGAP